MKIWSFIGLINFFNQAEITFYDLCNNKFYNNPIITLLKNHHLITFRINL
jgi:hypothetical protein